jgi:hypothetical protein
MLKTAKEIQRVGRDCIFFTNDIESLKSSDYTLASGIFNVKQNSSKDIWTKYILDELAKINRTCTRGFAFNMLTIYSEIEKMRRDLYYGDPLFFFDYCKKNFSKYVSLLHDYPLYEFTLIVKK